jgi:hypothetical protein
MKLRVYLIAVFVFYINASIGQTLNDSTEKYKERANSLQESQYGNSFDKYMKWVLSFPVNSDVIKDLYGDGINSVNNKIPILFPCDTAEFAMKFRRYQKQLIDSCLTYCNKNNIQIDAETLKKIKDGTQFYWNIDKSNRDTIASLKKTFWLNLAKIYINKEKVENEKYPIYTHGIGNKSFKLTPQFLFTIFSGTPTIKTIELTLPNWTSYQDKFEFENGRKQYNIDLLTYNISIEYVSSSLKLEKIKISHLTPAEVKSFEQKLIVFGYILNPRLTDLANSINKGVGGWHEYYSKNGTKVTFVLKSNQITVFK